MALKSSINLFTSIENIHSPQKQSLLICVFSNTHINAQSTIVKKKVINYSHFTINKIYDVELDNHYSDHSF